jgi:ribose transport system substrate-binding protein
MLQMTRLSPRNTALLALVGAIATWSGSAYADSFFKEPLKFDFTEKERGPNGEPATPASEVKLTDDEVAKVKAGNYTAALLWAGAGEWYDALGAGAKARFEELNIKVVATTDAQFDAAKQASDVETAMTLKPSAILTLIVDPVSGAAGFRPAIDAGVKLVLADNGAQGYVAGKDYVGIVTGDHYGMGAACAELMNDALSGKGKIGYIFHDAEFFVTNNRDHAFRAAIEQRYPGIEIIDAKGFTAENATFDAAAAMISQHPEINGIYVAWDVAAEGVVEAIRAAGRNDIKVVTLDLGATNDLDMAKGGAMYATVADKPYEMGVTMANLAAYSLLGKAAPPFSTVGFIKVTKNNLAEAWRDSLNKDMPADIKKVLGQ